MSVRRRQRQKNPSDSERWAELEAGERRGATDVGGGAYFSASAWRAKTYPLFPDELTNALLQAIDGTGGVGVRFTADSIIRELPGKLARGGVGIRMRIGKAIEALEEQHFIQPHSELPLPKGRKKRTRPWSFTWELTQHGSDAALAARVVPEILKAESFDPGAGPIPEHFYAPKESQPFYATPELAEAERELEARVHAQQGIERLMPWRVFTESSSAWDPEALETGQRFRFVTRRTGPYMAFGAIDESVYLHGDSILVGEIGVLPGSGADDSLGRHATVVWFWIHPEWDSHANPVVARELLRLAANEAAKHGLALASAPAMAPAQDRIWDRQRRAGLATHHLANGTLRYMLKHPPPEKLANPRGKMRRVNPGQDEALRTLEREAQSDPAARVKWYAALLRAGKAFPEYMTALAILGDSGARAVAPPGPEWRYADGSQTVHLKYVNGLSSLGSFFSVMSTVAIFESILAKWNDEARRLRPRIRRILAVARSWLAGGVDPHVQSRGLRRSPVRTPGPIRGRAIEVRRRFDGWHGAAPESSELIDQQELAWFYRIDPATGRILHGRERTYTDAALYMLERAVYQADLATTPDYGHLDLAAQGAATTAIGHCESLYTNHLAITANADLTLPHEPARYLGPANEAFARVLRYVLTPWVLAGSPGQWVLAKVPPLP